MYYFLGAGSMGALLAHHLAQHTATPITLLLSNANRVKVFAEAGNTIKVISHQFQNTNVAKSTFQASYRGPYDSQGLPIPISNLVISTKTYQTATALKPYLHHLNKDSTVLLVQNGMGMAQKLIERYWPNENNRPNLYQAISTHGSYRTDLFTIHHSSQGAFQIGSCGEDPKEWPELIKAIVASPLANATTMSANDHLLVQMEKLVANAVINPLTAVLDCLNGELLEADIAGVAKAAIREATDVFWAEYPQLNGVAKARVHLDRDRLFEYVLGLCKSTSANSSSMREDVRSLNTTELSSINGFIVDLGRKHKLATPINRSLMTMVRAKLDINKARERVLEI